MMKLKPCSIRPLMWRVPLVLLSLAGCCWSVSGAEPPRLIYLPIPTELPGCSAESPSRCRWRRCT